jgi:hypothetical protein
MSNIVELISNVELPILVCIHCSTWLIKSKIYHIANSHVLLHIIHQFYCKFKEISCCIHSYISSEIKIKSIHSKLHLQSGGGLGVDYPKKFGQWFQSQLSSVLLLSSMLCSSPFVSQNDKGWGAHQEEGSTSVAGVGPGSCEQGRAGGYGVASMKKAATTWCRGRSQGWGRQWWRHQGAREGGWWWEGGREEGGSDAGNKVSMPHNLNLCHLGSREVPREVGTKFWVAHFIPGVLFVSADIA